MDPLDFNPSWTSVKDTPYEANKLLYHFSPNFIQTISRFIVKDIEGLSYISKIHLCYYLPRSTYITCIHDKINFFVVRHTKSMKFVSTNDIWSNLLYVAVL